MTNLKNMDMNNIFTKTGVITAICELLKTYSGDYDTFALQFDDIKVFDDESKAMEVVESKTVGKCLDYIRENSEKPFSKLHYIDINGNIDYLSIANDTFRSLFTDDTLSKIGYWEIIDDAGVSNQKKNDELIQKMLKYNGMESFI